MTHFFIQREVLDEKIIISLKYGNAFTQIMIHYLKNKVGVVHFANAQGLEMF